MNIIRKQCIECGYEFTANHINQQTCSDECRRERHNRRNKAYLKKFIAGGGVTSSKQRYRDYLKEKDKYKSFREFIRAGGPKEKPKKQKMKNCAECGSVFVFEDMRGNGFMYCSEECRVKAVKQKMKEYNHKRREHKRESYYANITESRRKALESYRKRKNEVRAYWQNQKQKLSDAYIAKILRKHTCLWVRDIPKAMIEAKRLQLSIINHITKE